jgi:hypothetical protein
MGKDLRSLSSGGPNPCCSRIEKPARLERSLHINQVLEIPEGTSSIHMAGEREREKSPLHFMQSQS